MKACFDCNVCVTHFSLCIKVWVELGVSGIGTNKIRKNKIKDFWNISTSTLPHSNLLFYTATSSSHFKVFTCKKLHSTEAIYSRSETPGGSRTYLFIVTTQQSFSKTFLFLIIKTLLKIKLSTISLSKLQSFRPLRSQICLYSILAVLWCLASLWIDVSSDQSSDRLIKSPYLNSLLIVLPSGLK